MFEGFPYTNFHELNLDWIIKMIKELNDKFDEAISAKIKFADPVEWDITKQYEVLTIVIDDNKAYLSMQPVPSGVAITNTEYWQNIFDMSELIQMQEDFEEYMTDKYDDLKEQVEDAIEELEENLSTEIERVESESVKNNSVKHLLYVGDSYSTWYSNQLYNAVVAGLGIPAAQCHNVAVSGASFNDNSNSYLMQIQGYSGNKNIITDILIVGGINDALLAFNDYTYSYPDVTSVTNAIDAFKQYCNNNYPNAVIHIAYVGGCLPSSTYYETLHPEKSQEWAKWCYTLYAEGKGYNVLKTWNAIHTSSINYGDDGLHPSSSYGIKAIADSVVHAFNGNPSVSNRPQLIVQIPATGKNSRSVSGFSFVQNDIASVIIPDDYIQIRNGETISISEFTPILSLTGSEIPSIRTPLFFNISAYINGFTGVTGTVIPVEVRIQDGEIAIKPFYNSGGSWQTLTAGTFSTLTFMGIPPIKVPIWEAN